MTQQHAADDDDATLAERIRFGDSEALGVLYDRYAALALGVALRIVTDRAQAEDVVHDGFVAVWQKIGGFDASRGTLRTWLLTVVRNRAVDRVRRRRPTVEIDAADEQPQLSSGGNPTWDEALQEISAEQVRRAINLLPDEQRTAIELAYFRGHTYREIAEITGVPHGTASGRLRLALAKLRESLRRTEAAPLSVSSPAVATEVDR